MERKSKSSGFKMKAGKEGPMRKNFPSVFKKLDVQVGDELFTGEDAYEEGLKAEAMRQKVRKEGGVGSFNYEGKTKEEIASYEKKKARNIAEQTKKIAYTGDDAHKRINREDWSFPGGAEAKEKAHAKVRAGGSYTV
jgi:hypothetical protein